MVNKYFWIVIALSFLSSSCSRLVPKDPELPIMGPRSVVEKLVDGKKQIDTIYHTIPDFAFLNQDSQVVSLADFENKIFVTDFFFTSCPTICPVMKTQMLRLYEVFEKENRLRLLSFSIDPEHDTVALLKAFADQLGVSAPRWNMLTGDKNEIYELGQGSFMVTAKEDASEPGGIVHSGAFILVDTKKRIRGYYDGTKSTEVDKLIVAINQLLNEQE